MQEIALDGPVAWLLGGPDRHQRADLRPRAGAARRRRPGRRVAAFAGAILDRQRRRPPPAPRPRGVAVRHRHAAADRRGAAAREPQRVEERRPRLRRPARSSRASIRLPSAQYRGRRRASARRGTRSSGASPRCRASPASRSPTACPPNGVGNFNNFDLEERPDAAGKVAARHTLGGRHARVLPGAGPHAARGAAARRAGCAAGGTATRSWWTGRGPAGSSRARARSASGSAKADAPPARGPRWSAS